MSEPMEKKRISGYLKVDWKGEKISGRKTMPNASELGANELVVPVEIDVAIPKPEVPTLQVNVEAPHARVEAGELEQIPADEQPGWTNIADQLLADRSEEIENSDDVDTLEQIEQTVTAKTLIDAPGRPQAQQVSDYAHESIMEIVNAQ